MAVEDAHFTRTIQRELGRRYVDASLVDVRVMHGICYVRGTMRCLRSHPNVDLTKESETIRKMIRQKGFIREVIWEVDLRN
ncbi:MAG: hypothetical protein NT029_20605 [Armatimonadetes bacterium]|jgi:hypothetical protein|nr:hypothetical protein [Armatimonadota bacterium]